MEKKKLFFLVAAILSFVFLAGCGVSKNKYEALLNEKIALEGKATQLEKAKTALKNEYDKLLDEKMDLAVKLEASISEKKALKDEYDKLLGEKLLLKAAYDKVIAENPKAQ